MEQPSSSAPQASQPPQSPRWGDNTKRIVGIIAFVFVALLLFQFRSVITLVFSAVVIAYLFHPIADFFQERLLRGRLRVVAVLLTFLLMISLVVLALLFVLPTVIVQMQSLISNTPEFLESAQDWILDRLDDEIDFTGTPLERFFGEPLLVADIVGIEPSNIDVENMFDAADLQIATFDTVETLRQFVATISGSAFSFVGGALSTGLNLIFLLTMIFYLLTDGENMINAVVGALPEGYQNDMRRMLRELGHVWNSYLRGQVTLSLIMGFAMYFMARILGIPNAIFLGIFAGLMEFIPNIGPATAMIPAAAIALFSESNTIPGLQGVFFALVVIGVWTILQQTEAAVLIPRIVGDSLNLHPFIVIVAVVSGVSVGGIFAVLIAAPVVASLRLVAQYVYGKLSDKEPFPVNRKTVSEHQRERRPVLVRLGDYCATRVRNLMSSKAVTRRQ